MAKKVVWTPEAISTFEKVIAYLEEEWSVQEIQSFIEATGIVVEYISHHPQMFRRTNKRNIREALVTPHNLLIYKIYPDHISLLTFWDTRQHPRKKKKRKKE